jgi:uncharacterized protein YndB with AHSA1/START domain
MSTRIDVPSDEPILVMTRIYDAPRALVWKAITRPEHVRKWWGGPGFSNPVCEMDVRPGGSWNHVMRFPNGHELVMQFVFLEVDEPARLSWQHADHGARDAGPPTSVTTITLEDLGPKTRWTMVARFRSLSDREAALAMGYTGPIEASSEQLTRYLETMTES